LLKLLIRLGCWAEDKRDTAILKYASQHPKATAGDIAQKFGLSHHQTVTGITRQNGIKRVIHPTDEEIRQHQIEDAAQEHAMTVASNAR
jgi:hypothetical protein